MPFSVAFSETGHQVVQPFFQALIRAFNIQFKLSLSGLVGKVPIKEATMTVVQYWCSKFGIRDKKNKIKIKAL